MIRNIMAGVSRYVILLHRLVNDLRSSFLKFSKLQQSLAFFGAVLLPLYTIQGHIFKLPYLFYQLVRGQQPPITSILLMTLETALVSYVFWLTYSFWPKKSVRSEAPTEDQGFFKISYVPKHLLDERPEGSTTESELSSADLMALNLTSPDVVEKLPKALEILRDSAAMLDIYKHNNPTASEEEDDPETTKSLLDILNDARRPPIKSEDDLNRI